MLGLKLSIRALCLIAFATGAADMFAGVQLLIAGGGHLAGVARDPVLNSQIAFWGAIWFGFGIVLWRTSSRLRADATLFRILCGITALSGLARLVAALTYGSPGLVLTVAMVVEIGGGVALFLWHAAAVRGELADVQGVPGPQSPRLRTIFRFTSPSPFGAEVGRRDRRGLREMRAATP